MPNPLTEAREDLATALSAMGWPVYAYTPNTVTANTIVITPSSPWMLPKTLGTGLTATTTLTVSLLLDDREHAYAMTAAEDALVALWALVPAGWTWGAVQPPRLLSFGGQGSLTVVEFDLTATIKE